MAGGPSTLAQTARLARRALPLAIAVYRRWNELPPERKEHYKRVARTSIERSRRTIDERLPKRRR